MIPKDIILRRPRNGQLETPWLPVLKKDGCNHYMAGKMYINLSELAKVVEVDPSYISYIIRGLRQPTQSKFMRMAAALKLTGDQLYAAIQYKRMMREEAA